MFHLLKFGFYWSEECIIIKALANKVSNYECYTVVVDVTWWKKMQIVSPKRIVQVFYYIKHTSPWLLIFSRMYIKKHNERPFGLTTMKDGQVLYI